MDLQSEILSKEERFWTSDAAYYEKHLASDVMMILPPPTGVLDRATALASLAAAPRWRSIEIKHPRVCVVGSAVAVGYHAVAWREGIAADYEALVGSLYVLEGGEWKLAFHQHTPVKA